MKPYAFQTSSYFLTVEGDREGLMVALDVRRSLSLIA